LGGLGIAYKYGMETTKLTLHASWEEVKEKIKERNIGLTDEDLVYEPGQEDALLERLAKKMNRSKEEVKQFIESISYNKDVAS
jgi:uncharacterized protein YjbJ (UPF0337 family)